MPGNSGVSKANFPIIRYLALGEDMALPGVPHGVGHVTLARGVLGHPGAHRLLGGSNVLAALGVGWGRQPPQPPRPGGVFGRILGIWRINRKKEKGELDRDKEGSLNGYSGPTFRPPRTHLAAAVPPRHLPVGALTAMCYACVLPQSGPWQPCATPASCPSRRSSATFTE